MQFVQRFHAVQHRFRYDDALLSHGQSLASHRRKSQSHVSQPNKSNCGFAASF